MRNRILISVAAFAVIPAACGDTGNVVATIDGDTITYDEVLALSAVTGDTIDNEAFARTLYSLVIDHAIVASADSEMGISVTEAEVDVSVEDLLGPLIEGGVSREDILVANNLTEEGLRAVGAQLALKDAVIGVLVEALDDPPEDELLGRYNSVLASEANVCSAHILFESEEEAQAALDRALAGEDFGTLAMELSTGPSGPSGGDLGCGAPSQFVAEFSFATLQAEVGVPHGPIRSSFGWHVILVSERTAPTFEDLRDDIVANLAAEQGEELWTNWLVATLEAAAVFVEPEYGTWTTEPVPSIIPPGT